MTASVEEMPAVVVPLVDRKVIPLATAVSSESKEENEDQVESSDSKQEPPPTKPEQEEPVQQPSLFRNKEFITDCAIGSLGFLTVAASFLLHMKA